MKEEKEIEWGKEKEGESKWTVDLNGVNAVLHEIDKYSFIFTENLKVNEKRKQIKKKWNDDDYGACIIDKKFKNVGNYYYYFLY